MRHAFDQDLISRDQRDICGGLHKKASLAVLHKHVFSIRAEVSHRGCNGDRDSLGRLSIAQVADTVQSG